VLLRAMGALREGRTGVSSYLLTEQWYCRSLIRRGFRDALAQRVEIAEFLEQPLEQRRRVARAPIPLSRHQGFSSLPPAMA
jgi:hypothetical protein